MTEAELLRKLRSEQAVGWHGVSKPRPGAQGPFVFDESNTCAGLSATMEVLPHAATPSAVGPAKGVYEEPLGGPPMQTHHTRITPAPVKVER